MNRSSDLVRNMLAVLFIAGMIAASLWILSPFLPALIWATLLVVATWPLMLAVQRRLWLGLPPLLAGAVLVATVVAVVGWVRWGIDWSVLAVVGVAMLLSARYTPTSASPPTAAVIATSSTARSTSSPVTGVLIVLSAAFLTAGSLPANVPSAANASGPDTRTTATPARPAADDNAQIVSWCCIDLQ